MAVEEELEVAKEEIRELRCLMQEQLLVKIPEDPEKVVTKEGRSYSPQIRKLYYSLLTNGVSPAKAADIIKSVIHCLQPDIDTDINSDGTTKNQHKINGVAINGTVFSLNEVPDGTAESIINDIDQELNQLRLVATKLGFSDSETNSINWTLIASSTSDGASTQKKFDCLLVKRQEEDAVKFGFAEECGLKLVENFCAMHLGVNLRKSFLEGINTLSKAEGARESDQLETFIYEFVKLYGKHGVPEYGIGAVKFADFLQLCVDESGTEAPYYQACQSITLDRQVGSHYFVSASNAGKVLFLASAAMQFLDYTGKISGNKLERSVYQKLNDPIVLAGLKADSLMFYHVYADLVMLAKSNELGKSAFDMGKHYLELKVFLEEVQRDPEVAINNEHQVFSSERRLYTR